ncbi:hypothetical protein PGSY75_0418000, partial [Plasmodium gaboni]
MNENPENNFNILDVSPRYVEFFYECLEDVDTFAEKKKENIIEKKSLKIKNICSKIQNIEIFETEYKYLKIKGSKKKKLAPGTCENICIEFSLYNNMDIKKYKNDKKKEDVLNIINNIERTIFLKIKTEYTSLSIPIYIKKKVAIFFYDNIINFGLCKQNMTYHYSMKVTNVGQKKGTLTICSDMYEGMKGKRNHIFFQDDKVKIKKNESCVINNNMNNDNIKNNHNVYNKKEKNILEDEKKDNTLISFDKTSITLDMNESDIINIEIKNIKEEKVHREYNILTLENSYFVENPRNIIIIAVFINSCTSFYYENIKTKEININYIYYGNKKKIQGQIKNENNYNISYQYKMKKVHAFYTLESFKKYLHLNNLSAGSLEQ